MSQELSLLTHPRLVEFHETDAAGLVHFSNYFRWMEAAEAAWFRSVGLDLFLDTGGEIVGFPKVAAQCTYAQPLHFGDAIEVRLSLIKLRAAALTYRATVWRVGVGTPCLCATGEWTTVSARRNPTDHSVEARNIPDVLRRKFAELGWKA